MSPDDPNTKHTNRSIFRPDAIRRYMEGREESVFPRLVTPRTIIYLWILLGLLVVSGLVAWLTEVPVYASGLAVVVDHSRLSQDIQDDVALVAFLPPERHPQVGQTLWLQFGMRGERLSKVIMAVEPEIRSPDDVQRQFGLGGNAALAITQPTVVAIARFEPSPTDLPARTYMGSVYHVDVKVGSRRLISLLPVIGNWFYEVS